MHFFVQVHEEAGDGESPQMILLNSTEAVWRCSSQRATLTISRLVSDGFVAVSDVLDWAFERQQFAGNEAPNGSVGTSVPRMVAEDEMTATMALETVVSMFVTLIDQSEVCSCTLWVNASAFLLLLSGIALNM